MIKRLLLLALLFSMTLPVFAQDSGGQFWVQAFEDRNGNMQHDAGEPFLTRGVSVDLLNSEGIVMATGKLDDAPYASRGFIGFLYLSPGSYTAVITSPDLAPTTPDRVDVNIAQGAEPVTVMFGAQRAAAAETAATPISSSPLLNTELARIALAGFGGLLVVFVMAALGFLVYLIVLRPRAPKDVRRTTTGTMRPVPAYETGGAYVGEVSSSNTGRSEPPRATAAARLASDLGRTEEPPRPSAETSPLDQPFKRPPDTTPLE